MSAAITFVTILVAIVALSTFVGMLAYGSVALAFGWPTLGYVETFAGLTLLGLVASLVNPPEVSR